MVGNNRQDNKLGAAGSRSRIQACRKLRPKLRWDKRQLGEAPAGSNLLAYRLVPVGNLDCTIALIVDRLGKQAS